MDYKEKYENALEKARELKNKLEKNCSLATPTGIESIFPELAESEDERTLRMFKEYLKNEIECYTNDCRDDDDKQKLNTFRYILSWLEKQGEKQDYNPYKATIESIAAMIEKYTNGDLRDFYDNIKVKCKDAMEYDKTWNEKQGKQKPADLPNGDDYGIDGLWHAKTILEKTLGKVEGYQSDDGILEHKCAINVVKNLYERKPAWREEDEKMRQDTICFIETGWTDNGKSHLISWLKSLKPQNHWKPTGEQMEDFKLAIVFLEDYGYSTCNIKSLYEQLKKL